MDLVFHPSQANCTHLLNTTRVICEYTSTVFTSQPDHITSSEALGKLFNYMNFALVKILQRNRTN